MGHQALDTSVNWRRTCYLYHQILTTNFQKKEPPLWDYRMRAKENWQMILTRPPRHGWRSSSTGCVLRCRRAGATAGPGLGSPDSDPRPSPDVRSLLSHRLVSEGPGHGDGRNERDIKLDVRGLKIKQGEWIHRPPPPKALYCAQYTVARTISLKNRHRNVLPVPA